MRRIGAARGLRRAFAALAVLCGVWTVAPRLHGARHDAEEVRALWVLRSSLTSPASIASLVRTAREQGFNTLLVQVRGRGDAYYRTDLEPRATDLSRQPDSFDPLATLLGEARAAGVRVHAWINLNLVSSAVDLPSSREHVIYRHPEWLMVPRPIAQEVAKEDASNPAYTGRVARWTRGQLDLVEGLYVSPVLPDAAAYAEHLVADLAKRYDLDGIHLDYARFPNPQYDYSRFAIGEFRSDARPRLSAATRAKLDAEDTVDLFAYPDALPQEWNAFRRARQTALVARIRNAIRTAKPSMMLTAAVAPDAAEAFDARLQDWRGWLAGGLIDAVCPMAYTQESARFVEQISAAREAAGPHAVWAGIGAYRLTPSQTIDDIQAARRLGAAGFVLFSYDSLTGAKPPAADYLATVSRGAFAAAAAPDSAPK
jgi:uncharacterized lipoprotein YddW (UPF0748 family)